MRNLLGGCPFNFTSPVEPVRNGPSSFAYSRSLSHLVRFGTSAQSSQIWSLVAVVSLLTSMTSTLVVVPTIAPDTATAASTRTTTSPVLIVTFFTRWLSLSPGVFQPGSPQPGLLIGQVPSGLRQCTLGPRARCPMPALPSRWRAFPGQLPGCGTAWHPQRDSAPSCPFAYSTL